MVSFVSQLQFEDMYFVDFISVWFGRNFAEVKPSFIIRLFDLIWIIFPTFNLVYLPVQLMWFVLILWLQFLTQDFTSLGGLKGKCSPKRIISSMGTRFVTFTLAPVDVRHCRLVRLVIPILDSKGSGFSLLVLTPCSILYSVFQCNSRGRMASISLAKYICWVTMVQSGWQTFSRKAEEEWLWETAGNHLLKLTA